MKNIVAYTNARLMDPESGLDCNGSLITNGGHIDMLGADVTIPAGVKIIDCGGRILSPGIIDMRAHQVDSDAAAAGGITTIILQPDQTTIIDTDAPVERIIRRAENPDNVRVYPMGAATKGFMGREIAEIGQMKASGAVAFTDCNHAVADAQVMRRLLTYAGFFDALIVQFAEEASLAAGGFAHDGSVADRLGLAAIPVSAEVIQIERDARLAEMTGARLHIALVSSREGLNAIRAAKARGVQISCGVAPHYLQLNENDVEGFRSFAKVSPPLRSEEDRLALVDGLSDGTIDVICSDHNGKSEDTKRLPFAQASNGIAGFETLLALALAPAHAGRTDIMTVLKTLTITPANLLGLSSGRLAVGAPADIMIFDPNAPWRIDPDSFIGRHRNTPFATIPVQGKVWRTMAQGHMLFSSEA